MAAQTRARSAAKALVALGAVCTRTCIGTYVYVASVYVYVDADYICIYGCDDRGTLCRQGARGAGRGMYTYMYWCVRICIGMYVYVASVYVYVGLYTYM